MWRIKVNERAIVLKRGRMGQRKEVPVKCNGQRRGGKLAQSPSSQHFIWVHDMLGESHRQRFQELNKLLS